MTPRISVLTPSIRPQFLDITQQCLENQTFKDFEWLVEVDLRNQGFLLPRAMNRMLKRAQGKLVVILQDCISIPPEFLDYVNNSCDLISFKTFPVSKDGVFDWRMAGSRPIEPQEWEADLAVAPLKAFFDIGGYDESFCSGWSWENVEVAYRAKVAGYKFFCDRELWGTGIDHDKQVDHPFRNELKSNALKAETIRKMAEEGDYKLTYL
ncbi:MAG: hypothetical protein [Siphoviridae sp. cttb18]|nr:MAG: hypothetical protein [Siphoviridae sp. cttb18]